jgi:hypothetical protein
LNLVGVHSVAEYVVVAIPEVDLVVVGRCGDKFDVSMLDVVSGYKSTSFSSTLFRHTKHPLSRSRVINFKTFAVALHYQQVFELIEIVHMLDFRIVLSIFNVRRLVVFDCIYKDAVFPHHT